MASKESRREGVVAVSLGVDAYRLGEAAVDDLRHSESGMPKTTEVGKISQ